MLAQALMRDWSPRHEESSPSDAIYTGTRESSPLPPCTTRPDAGDSHPIMPTYTLEAFWAWLMRHPNCILRAGTAEAALYDDDDFHWHFASEGTAVYVQVIRGKHLIGEVGIDTERISYVQYVGEETEGEHMFELVVEDEARSAASHFFVLSHGLDDEDEASAQERAVH